ncbi:hypothetical protein SDC9_19934 [bioreactor metagenome]|uniref:Uncharacterized protein n=1 Tax=bioreactor metagenome TaxID=1076179 RepID=A0A644U5B9_9ZZZZ
MVRGLLRDPTRDRGQLQVNSIPGPRRRNGNGPPRRRAGARDLQLGSDDLLPGLRPVLEELVEPLVGQHVVRHRLDHGGRRGDHVGADLRAFGDVVHVADRGSQDFRLVIVVVIDRADVVDQLDTVEVDVVKPADERRDEARPGLRREDRLRGREAQRDVDHVAFGCESLAGGQAIPGERHLDRDIGGDLGKLQTLGDHVLRLGGHDLGRDRARNHVADLLRHLEDVAARFQDQRGVGGDTVDHAEIVQFLDRRHIGGIDEEFHGKPPEQQLRAR